MNLTTLQKVTAFAGLCLASLAIGVGLVVDAKTSVRSADGNTPANSVTAGGADPSGRSNPSGGSNPSGKSRTVAPMITYDDRRPATLQAALNQPHFLSVRYPHFEGEAFQLEVIRAQNPGSKRVKTDLPCQRVYFRSGRGLCVESPSGPATTVKVFDASLRVTRTLALFGSPSRVRVSPAGRYGAITNFISGHSYSDASFSTATYFLDLGTGAWTNLEAWDAFRGSDRITDAKRNFWGVTFVSETVFYATLGIGRERYLVEGDATTRRLEVIRDNIACPSVSPDGKRLTFRRSVVEPNGVVSVPLFLLDLSTGAERRLPEKLDIDDQPEWLDNHRIVYGTPTGPPNIVVLDVDDLSDSSMPAVLFPDAWNTTYVGSQ